jgi:hypothetical protein
MNKKYLILGGVLIAIGGVGYFLYKKFVTDKVTKMATEVDQDIAQAEAMAQAMTSQPKPIMVSSSGSPVSIYNPNTSTPVAYTPSGAPIYLIDKK